MLQRIATGVATVLTVVGLMAAQPGPDNFSGNKGTLKVINSFTQGFGQPGPLIEVQPGFFTG